MYDKQLLQIFEQTYVNKRKSKQVIYTVWEYKMYDLVHVTRGYTGCGDVRYYVNKLTALHFSK